MSKHGINHMRLLCSLSCPCASVLLYFALTNLPALESLLVVRELGVQVTTKYVDGREKSTVSEARPLRCLS